MSTQPRFRMLAASAAATLMAVSLAAGAEGPAAATSGEAASGKVTSSPQISQLTPARPGKLAACDHLKDFGFASTEITNVEIVPEGTITYASEPVPEHCRVTGKMNERVSPVDGKTYAIGFEMRLPTDWSGRFLYQGGGGLDGVVNPALGTIRGQREAGLQLGIAVLTTDAGHNEEQIPLFGLDPQARLDYGYQAVDALTPMAKRLVEAAYGRGPDRAYIAGGSNGGRNTVVAASRSADEYDGYLAVAPALDLPKVSVAQLWGAQQYAKVATDISDLETALPSKKRQVIADAIRGRCDSLDNLADGMVQAITVCQHVFDLDRDVPTCQAKSVENCLSREQKAVVGDIFAGARTSAGDDVYSTFPYDPGLVQPAWATWEFRQALNLSPMAVAFPFSTPPAHPTVMKDLHSFALGYDVDTRASELYATTDTYTESAMSFTNPPNPTNLDTLRDRGAKMIVVHGGADPLTSPDVTARWYDKLDNAYHQQAEDFVRYFEVPGMGHVNGGPATDQWDGLGTLIDWVEYGHAPDRITASARGEGNPDGVNPDIPADWAPNRTRPLCPYPSVARYTTGDPERADSFLCAPSPRRTDRRGPQ